MLKNKLFYFVVFAAAAIFAVTFVACDSSTTNNVVGGIGAEKDDLVEWVPLGEEKGSAKSIWTVSLDNGIPSVLPPANYYTLGDIVKASAVFDGVAADGLIGTSDLTENSLYEVFAYDVAHATPGNRTKATYYFPADGDGKLISKVATNGKKVSLGTGVIAASEQKTVTGGAIADAVTSATTGDIFNVDFVNSASWQLNKHYYAASSATALTGISGSAGFAKIGSKAYPVTELVAVTSGVAANALSADGTANDRWQVEFINSADGSMTTQYWSVDSSDQKKLKSGGTTVAGAIKVKGTSPAYPASGLKAATGGAAASALGAGGTEDDLWEVEFIDGTTCLLATQYWSVDSSTATTLNGPAGVAGAIKVKGTSPAYLASGLKTVTTGAAATALATAGVAGNFYKVEFIKDCVLSTSYFRVDKSTPTTLVAPTSAYAGVIKVGTQGTDGLTIYAFN